MPEGKRLSGRDGGGAGAAVSANQTLLEARFSDYARAREAIIRPNPVESSHILLDAIDRARYSLAAEIKSTLQERLLDSIERAGYSYESLGAFLYRLGAQSASLSQNIVKLAEEHSARAPRPMDLFTEPNQLLQKAARDIRDEVEDRTALRALLSPPQPSPEMLRSAPPSEASESVVRPPYYSVPMLDQLSEGLARRVTADADAREQLDRARKGAAHKIIDDLQNMSVSDIREVFRFFSSQPEVARYSGEYYNSRIAGRLGSERRDLIVELTRNDENFSSGLSYSS